MIHLDNNKGIALIMVLLMVLVVGVLSGSLLVAYNSNISQSSNYAKKTRAFYAAEGGANYLEAYINNFNEEEGSLGFYLPYEFDNRYNKITEEIKDLNTVEIGSYEVKYNLNEISEDTFEVEITARDGINQERIMATYRIGSEGLSFFAHTLAARSIEINGTLTLEGGYPDADSFPTIATGEKSSESDLTKDNIDLQELVGWWIFRRYESMTGSDYDEAYEKTFEFYGNETDKELYLPESDQSEEFTAYVRGINFREVLKQNGISNYIIEYDENDDPVTVSLSQFDYADDESETQYDISEITPDIDPDKLDLSNFTGDFPEDLNGYYENMDDFKDYSNSDTGPYIYIDDFNFTPSRGRGDYQIDFTNINTVNTETDGAGVVQMYIDDDIDFSNTNSNIYFKSRTEKSILVQSGGSEINLDNNRILYYSSGYEGQIKSIAYYAPNATMRIAGRMPGTGWGQSYNVNKIIMEDDVTFPTFEYDPEESGLYGNIHPDIAGYFGDEDDKELVNKFPGETFRTKWRQIK